MEQTRTLPARETPRTRGAEHFVVWLGELGECRVGGLLSDEDFAYQRAEKLDELIKPPRVLWLASLLGGMILGGIGWGVTWWFTRDWRFTTFGAALAGLWGLTSLGRVLRERFVDVQRNERMKILIALLDHDLISAAEFSVYEEQLAQGRIGGL